jgi:DNA helicase INO80
LITKNTVEEKIVRRAKQKQSVQSTVYSGSALKADIFRPKEVVELLVDDAEEADREKKEEIKKSQPKFLRTKRFKKKLAEHQ